MEKFQKCIRENRRNQDFETIEQIGHGGFSTVYKVKNIIDDNFYSLKKLTLYIQSIKNNFGEEVEKVLREVKFLASLDHPNILRYFNAWLEVKLLNKEQHKASVDKKHYKEQREEEECSQEEEEEDDNIFDSNLLEEDNEFELQIDFDEDEVQSQDLVNVQKSCSLNMTEPKMSQQEEAKIQPTFKNLVQPKPIKKNDNLELAAERGKIEPYNNFKKTLEKAKTPEPVHYPFSSHSPSLNIQELKSIHLYIQTELCAQTLDSYLSKRNCELSTLRTFSPAKYSQFWINYLKEALRLSLQLIQAIKYIHQSCKLVHRDLKPSNIFLTEDKILKVGDFGLVKKLEEFQTPQREFTFNCIQTQSAVSSASTATTVEHKHTPPDANSQPCGTLTYAAPEQIETNQMGYIFDQRADIYSLAMVLIQLFTPMKTQMEIFKVLEQARNTQMVPKVMENEVSEIATTVKKMLSSNPKKRPNLNVKLINQIQQCLQKEIWLAIKMQEERLNASDAIGCNIRVNFENSDQWIDKHLKIINGNLYFFHSNSEPKAETLYNLYESKIELNGPDADLNSDSYKLSKKNSNSSICNLESVEDFLSKTILNLKKSNSNNQYSIIIQHPIQLSCIIQGIDDKETQKIFTKILAIYETMQID